MKTSIKLLRCGVKDRPFWKLIVLGHKKNHRGRYIEHIGTWMPRNKNKTVARGVLMNMHKMRYWLSVGAEPTDAVVRVFNKYGGIYPKLPIPHGSSTLYEKPKKSYHYPHGNVKNLWHNKGSNAKYKYRQLL